MFIHQLFEAEAKRIIVTYPGRFQPFHKGHAEVFANLQKKFGGENVFIVTGNKTDSNKSPFNFSDKVQFMHAMGVPAHNIIETDKVYDLPAEFANIKEQVVFITVVGAPDAKRLNPGSFKKDGSPSYFQQMPSSATQFATADKHGYVIVEPEHPETISIGGQTYDVSHGTPCRELWNQVRDNPEQRAEFVQQLYGRNDPALAHVLDKIPTGAPEPAPKPSPKLTAVKQPKPTKLKEFAPPGSGDSNDGFSDDTLKRLAAQWWNGDEDPRIEQTLAAAGWEIGQDEGYDNGGAFVVQAGDVNGNSYMSWPAEELEGLGEGVVLTKDQKMDIYISGLTGKYPNTKKITKQVARDIPLSQVESYIQAVAEKYRLNPKAFVYGPSKSMSEDAAGVGVIANKKQKNDPRYSMSMTQDVGPGEDKKNMKKLHLESNRGYAHGFASPNAPSLGRRGREDDEYHVPDSAPSTWYIRVNGKIIKDKMGQPYQYRDKATANKAALSMMQKPFNTGKKFILTTKPVDDQPVAEAVTSDIARELSGIVAREDFDALYDLFSANTPAGHYVQDIYQDVTIDHRLHPDDDFEQIEELVFDRLADQFGGSAMNENTGPVTHRIGVTVTDPNHPMASKRGEQYQKTVRITQDVADREAAINRAIAHYRRKGFKVHDHHYIGTVDNEPINELSPKTLGSYAKKAAVDAKFKGHIAGAQQGDAMAHAKRPGDGVDAGSEMDDRAHKRLKGVARAVDKLTGQGVAEGSLEELANTSLDVKEPKDMYNVNDRKQTTYKLFKFKSGKNTFLINFTVKGAPAFGKKQNWNAVNVAFGIKEKQDDYSFGDEMNTDLTGRNKNQFLIYSTVINTIRRFITEYNTEIDEIIMQGAGERQEAMYQRFFQSAGKYFPGWHYNGKHSLVRDVPRKPVKKVREQGVAEGTELKQAKRKYNQAAKDANADQVGAGKKIDTMKKSLRQKDVDNKKQDINENAEELSVGDPVIITGKGIEFEGQTGDLYSFGDNKRFVIVDLYNHGKHSFHSSDVSYNEYADEDEVDESMYQYNKEDPYNSEFAPDVGMGRMTLRGWKQSLARRVAQLSQEMEQSTQGGSIDQAALWDNVYRKMQALNLDPIAQEIELAHQELERIRRQGGTRSRAFK